MLWPIWTGQQGARRRIPPESLRASHPVRIDLSQVPAYALLLGFLGTAVGVFQVGTVIQNSGSVSTALAWSAVRLALTTTIAGLAVFSLPALAWHALRAGYRRRIRQA